MTGVRSVLIGYAKLQGGPTGGDDGVREGGRRRVVIDLMVVLLL